MPSKNNIKKVLQKSFYIVSHIVTQWHAFWAVHSPAPSAPRHPSTHSPSSQYRATWADPATCRSACYHADCSPAAPSASATCGPHRSSQPPASVSASPGSLFSSLSRRSRVPNSRTRPARPKTKSGWLNAFN